MPRGDQGSVYVARESAVLLVDGQQEVIHKGVTRVRAGHPLFEQHSAYFEPADTGIQFDIEQATAAPGEKRGAPRSPVR